MDTQATLTPDPDLPVRFQAEIPEDVHQALSMLARRRKVTTGTVIAEGLRMLFEKLEAAV